MKHVLLLLSVPFFLTVTLAQDKPITDKEIVELLQAGISEDLIIDKIRLSGCNCDTSASGMMILKRAGASDALIRSTISQTPRAVTLPARPQSAQIPNVELDKTKLIVGEKEVDAILQFEGDQVRVVSKKGRSLLRTIAYANVIGSEYSYSKHRRWKSGIGAAVVGGVFAAPLFFMKGKKHWLTIRTESDQIGFRLDKNNFDPVISALEKRSGIRVERLGEDDLAR